MFKNFFSLLLIVSIFSLSFDFHAIHEHSHEHSHGHKSVHQHLHLHLGGRKKHSRHSHTAISLGLAFVLPGHIELIAVIFVLNLPLLFASTALAPISFMPYWLGWLASINPLTFAIEPIRSAYSGSFALGNVLKNGIPVAIVGEPNVGKST